MHNNTGRIIEPDQISAIGYILQCAGCPFRCSIIDEPNTSRWWWCSTKCSSHPSSDKIGAFVVKWKSACATPRRYWSLCAPKKMNLSNNRFVSLPDVLWNLSSLVSLDCSHNSLVYISSRIVSLHNLTQLDLEHNKLIELPETLFSMDTLDYLRFNHNELTTLPSNCKPEAFAFFTLDNNQFSSLPDSIGIE